MGFYEKISEPKFGRAGLRGRRGTSPLKAQKMG